MPFYKRVEDELLFAPNFVIGPGFELRAESKDDHTYPVDGWVWANNLDEAMSHPALRQAAAPVEAVTMRQARKALLELGLLEAVEVAIDALPEPTRTEAKIEWEYSSEVQRHNGFVSNLAPLLGLSEADLDNLFALAATK